MQFDDLPAKVDRIVALLVRRGAPAIALSSPESLAWILDGARVSVPYAGPPVCAAIVDGDGSITVTALANEAARLRDEELPAGVTVRTVPWYEPLPAPPAGVLRESDVAPELRTARASLLPGERRRYAALGGDIAAAVGEALRAASPRETEYSLASRLVAAVVAAEAEPVVTLVAGEDRSHLPHPIPTGRPLGKRAMAVVGARRQGLVVNLTRWVSFGAGQGRQDAALREVEADAYAATRPGRRLSAILADIARAYARHGFGEAAWTAHHQGGPTGYLGRDPKATPQTHDRVVEGQAFAWNPWVPGAKAEDTMIVDASGPTVVTHSPDWPTVPVRGVARPLTLELP